MQDEIDCSEEMSPLTVKRFGEETRLLMGLRSWAVTLQPCSSRSQRWFVVSCSALIFRKRWILA